MTMENPNTKAGPYVGDGSTTLFEFDFEVTNASHLRVTHRDASGTETVLVEGVHYSITVGSIDNVNGGSITYPLSGPAMPSTEKLAIDFNIPIIQDANLRNQGTWNPKVVEKVFDEIYRILLQIDEELARSIKASITDTSFSFDDLVAAINAAAAHASNAATSAALAEQWALLAQEQGIQGILWGSTVSLTFSDSPFTVLASHTNTLFSVDTSGGAVQINAPSIAAVGEPFTFSVKKETDDSNTITIVPDGTDTIDGVAANDTLTVIKQAKAYFADEDTAPDDWKVVEYGIEAGDIVVDTFVAGTDYTAGVTSALTLSQSPNIEENLLVYFDGIVQHHTAYTVSSTTLSFTDAIPLGVLQVECRIGRELAIGVASHTPLSSLDTTNASQDDIIFFDSVTGKFIRGTITAITIDLTTDVTGVLPDANVADDLTVSGGTIENTPIGAVTPQTGDFTDFSSNLITDAGTFVQVNAHLAIFTTGTIFVANETDGGTASDNWYAESVARVFKMGANDNDLTNKNPFITVTRGAADSVIDTVTLKGATLMMDGILKAGSESTTLTSAIGEILAAALESSGVGAGTYRSVTVTAKGLVTGGSNPTIDISADTNLAAGENLDLVGDTMSLKSPLTAEMKADQGLHVAASVTNHKISSGAITVAATDTQISIEPETGTADDWDTINGGANGQILDVSAKDLGDTITVKHNTGAGPKIFTNSATEPALGPLQVFRMIRRNGAWIFQD